MVDERGFPDCFSPVDVSDQTRNGLAAGDDLLVVPASDILVVTAPAIRRHPVPVGQITGDVTDGYGDPLSDVCCQRPAEASGATSSDPDQVTGADGSFDFDQLGAGSYALEFEYCPVTQTLCQTQFYDGVISESDETDIGLRRTCRG